MGNEQTEFRKLADQLVEQRITQQVTLTAGASTFVEVNVPANRKVFLKGYGYSWFTSNTYRLSTGWKVMPSRTDQEGSPAIPAIYGTPFAVRNGGRNLRLHITNGDSSTHTYDVVFYILTDELLEVTNTGGDLTLNVGGASGTASEVSIVDSTGTTNVDVVTREDGKKALCVEPTTELMTATHTQADAGNVVSADLLAANAARRAALIVNDSDTVVYIKVDGAAAVLNRGIRLNANGGNYFMSAQTGNLTQAKVTGISTAASKSCIITEFV